MKWNVNNKKEHQIQRGLPILATSSPKFVFKDMWSYSIKIQLKVLHKWDTNGVRKNIKDKETLHRAWRHKRSNVKLKHEVDKFTNNKCAYVYVKGQWVGWNKNLIKRKTRGCSFEQQRTVSYCLMPRTFACPSLMHAHKSLCQINRIWPYES